MANDPRDVRGGISRRTFVAASLLGAVTFRASAPAVAAGARSGPWCVPLSKRGHDSTYDFSLNVLDATGDAAIFTLSDHIGRAVWLNFFTSWCGPCNAEAADVARMSQKYAGTVDVIGIDVAEKPRPVRAFRERHAIPFPIALDTTSSVFHSLGLHAYPTHIFLDAALRISCVSVGDLTPDQMENEIAVALARVPPRQA